MKSKTFQIPSGHENSMYEYLVSSFFTWSGNKMYIFLSLFLEFAYFINKMLEKLKAERSMPVCFVEKGYLNVLL